MAAARTLLAIPRVTPGYCLKYVWESYKAHGAVSDGKYYPTAKSAWDQTAQQYRHPGDRNPPPGVPVYWGAKPGSAAGDIVISMGGGIVACTDWPRAGMTGTTTLSQREVQIRRPYLGWAEVILGYPVALGSSGGGSLPLPTPVRRRNNVTLYKENATPANYALAGESPGTTANWIESGDEALAKAWGKVHGDAVMLSSASFRDFRRRYSEPVKTG